MTELVQNFQLVAFTQSASSSIAETIYSAIYNDIPMSVQKNKVPQPHAPFLSLASGEKSGASLAVQINDGRVDFFVRGIPDNNHPSQLEQVDVNWAFSHFAERYSLISKSLGPVYRLAIVTNSGTICETEQQAVTLFSEAVGIKHPGRDATAADLNFQINLRAKLANGRLINRLKRYSINTMMSGTFPHMQPNIFPGLGSTVKQSFIFNITKDFNSVPDSNAISEIDQMEVLNKIFKLREER